MQPHHHGKGGKEAGRGWQRRGALNLVQASRRILEPYVSRAGPLGRMVVTVLGMVAEMELGFIKERQAAGIAKAKANGVYKGRPVSLDHIQIRTLRSQGLGATAIAKQLGCSRGAIYKAMAGQ